MNTSKPLKRHKTLQPLSHDHHHGLMLSWKIRTGLKNKVSLNRIKKYADWFFKSHLLPHFTIEEDYIFSVLGDENDLVKKAKAEHRRLTRLFETQESVEKNLSRIEEELDAHIRFEERILFNEVQKSATEVQLKLIEEHHSNIPFVENTDDEFWIIKKT